MPLFAAGAAGFLLCAAIFWFFILYGRWSAKYYLPKQLPRVVKGRGGGLWLEWYVYDELSGVAVKQRKRYIAAGEEQ